MRDELDARGFAVAAADPALAKEALDAPFDVAMRVLGEPPLFVERQNIRPMQAGGSIASTRSAAPLHTDSQMILGVPATVQILICVRAARVGGQSHLVDGFSVLDHIAQSDRRLWTALFDEDVLQRFYFGEVRGPIAALRGGHFVLTHAPRPTEGSLSCQLGVHLAREPVHEIALRDGQVLVASNHRMLHGRAAFDDESERELVRLLVWLERPLAAPPLVVARAHEVAHTLDARLIARFKAVTALLRGAPPAGVAKELGVTEAELYALRDRFLSSAFDALR